MTPAAARPNTAVVLAAVDDSVAAVAVARAAGETALTRGAQVVVFTDGEVRLTRQGRRHLGARARNLRDTIIPGLVELRDGSDRDDSVLADHERATTELARICTVLATARPVEALPDDPDVVELGEAVTISLDGAPVERWVIVHPSEAAVGAGRTSARSPLGRALLGRRVGDEVEVAAPGGTYRCVIESATRTGTARPSRALRP